MNDVQKNTLCLFCARQDGNQSFAVLWNTVVSNINNLCFTNIVIPQARKNVIYNVYKVSFLIINQGVLHIRYIFKDNPLRL